MHAVALMDRLCLVSAQDLVLVYLWVFLCTFKEERSAAVRGALVMAVVCFATPSLVSTSSFYTQMAVAIVRVGWAWAARPLVVCVCA